MSIQREWNKLLELSQSFLGQPRLSFRLLGHLGKVLRGFNYAQRWEAVAAERAALSLTEGETTAASANPLRAFFDSRETGRGIWKCLHYFDIYHRHFSKFVGRDVKVLEIGVYSGGSLEMWRHYFGSGCRVYGVDIEEACKCYENEFTEIFIGDQADRGFWKAFKQRVPYIDILIDDGGHRPEQQIATIEEMLPHIRPGGVYLCEDIHGIHNRFPSYVHGLVKNLNAMDVDRLKPGIRPSAFQAWIQSVHFYPYVTVIEKADKPVEQFIAPKHGTEWQPFQTIRKGSPGRKPQTASQEAS